MGERVFNFKSCLLALMCGGLVPVGLAAPAAAADPPGNNGTVKIDDVVFDDAPDNEPHDGCIFQVDFYGFDEGVLDATVTFQLVPPTADDETIEVKNVPIGEDPAGGGTDLDGSATYDLSSALTGVDPHSQQGWHVKLTVHAEGSIGADTKFKVFWVEGCGDSTPPTSNPGDGGGNGNGGPPTTAVDPQGSTTPTTAVPDGGGLPDTGTNTGPLALAGAMLVAIGAGAIVLARRVYQPRHLKSG
jgi:LPXTG-motif cell wall-anchored protein